MTHHVVAIQAEIVLLPLRQEGFQDAATPGRKETSKNSCKCKGQAESYQGRFSPTNLALAKTCVEKSWVDPQTFVKSETQKILKELFKAFARFSTPLEPK